MGIRTNRNGGHGALSYQEHKEYWRNKAKEWMKNPSLYSSVTYFAHLYGLKNELKEMGYYDLLNKLRKEEKNNGKRSCDCTGKSDC